MTQVLTFWDPERRREVRYDFGRLQLPKGVSGALKSAFAGVTGALRESSRQQTWSHLKPFARFLRRQTDLKYNPTADPNLLLKYRTCLAASEISHNSAALHFNTARLIVRWLADDQGEPWSSVILPAQYSPFIRRLNKIRDNEITPELLHKIAAICKKEIDRVISQFAIGNQIRQGKPVSPQTISSDKLAWLREAISLETKGIYTRKELLRINRDAVQQIGLRPIAEFRYLTSRNALPYYLLLIIQTCGNPEGISNLDIDCLKPHPTDPMKSRITWDKPRARREQAYDVMANGQYSVVRCVTDLAQLTAPIRALAGAADTHKLMIVRIGRRAARIHKESLHLLLAQFRRTHSLPHFTFADLRRAAALALHQYSESVQDVKQALQHRDIRTSKGYLQEKRTLDRRFENVLRFQGEMIRLSKERTRTKARSALKNYGSVSGIHCRDPLAGIAPGSEYGRPCLQWLQCSRCPNAVVIQDDPKIVARIVRTQQSLQELRIASANSAGATQFFEANFRPTLEIISREILPKINRLVRQRADEIARTLPPVPLLE